MNQTITKTVTRTLTTIVAGLSIHAGGCQAPLSYCVKTTEIPIVDDIQEERRHFPLRTDVLCEKENGTIDVYRNGRLEYTIQ